MREPITTDTRISFIDLHDRLVVFNRPISCGMCSACLAGENGVCLYHGPYSPAGIVLSSTINEGVAP